MAALEQYKYNRGLITLSELADTDPAAAITAMYTEHKREFDILRERLTAMQLQLDAITDMIYDADA